MSIVKLLRSSLEMSRSEIEKVKLRLDRAYAAGRPLISDDDYDQFVRIFQKRFPNSKILVRVGANIKIKGAAKEKLPILVGSLDLSRPKDVAGWMRDLERESGQKQVGWLVEPKFDGASLLVSYKDGVRQRAWTRGSVVDGEAGEESRGFNVTETVKHMQGAISRLRSSSPYDEKREYLVRGEVVMHRSIFKEHYVDQPTALGKTYKTSRNMVAGLLNRIDPDKVSKDLGNCTFIAFNLFAKNKDGKWVRPNSAHKEWVLLTLMGFTVALMPVRYSAGHKKIYAMVKAGHEALRHVLPIHEVGGGVGPLAYWDHHPTSDEVVDRMNAIHKAVDIRCDGIVVQPIDNGFWQKRGEHLKRRPSYIHAVKLEAESQFMLESVVKEVEWKISKRGMMKPVIVLRRSLNFDGVDVNRCTGINARFILLNKIQSGRRVKLIRSGDTIPRLMQVFVNGEWKKVKI